MTLQSESMPQAVPFDLVAEIRRLVTLAGRDEHTAIMQFHDLVDTHGCAQVGAALAAAAPDELAELARPTVSTG